MPSATGPGDASLLRGSSTADGITHSGLDIVNLWVDDGCLGKSYGWTPRALKYAVLIDGTWRSITTLEYGKSNARA